MSIAFNVKALKISNKIWEGSDPVVLEFEGEIYNQTCGDRFNSNCWKKGGHSLKKSKSSTPPGTSVSLYCTSSTGNKFCETSGIMDGIWSTQDNAPQIYIGPFVFKNGSSCSSGSCSVGYVGSDPTSTAFNSQDKFGELPITNPGNSGILRYCLFGNWCQLECEQEPTCQAFYYNWFQATAPMQNNAYNNGCALMGVAQKEGWLSVPAPSSSQEKPLQRLASVVPAGTFSTYGHCWERIPESAELTYVREPDYQAAVQATALR
jgi:hypothetical protein